MSGGIENMIGQLRLKNEINDLIQTGFPRFTIIVGNTGGGKKLIARKIGEKLNAHLIKSGIKVQEIREIIDLAYKQTSPIVYLLPDADKMSSAAKNALLKITEEPPGKAYFIMTLKDLNNTLMTIKSRAVILNLDIYTPLDLLEYCKKRDYELNNQEQEIMKNICTVPGEVDTLLRYDILEFYDYVKTVVDSIGKVSGANAFKIGTKLNYKEDDGGWDITLFLRTVMFVSRLKLLENPLRKYRKNIFITSKYLSELNISGIHKASLIDMWILEMRQINREVA